MTCSTLTTKNQTTIPKAVIEAAGRVVLSAKTASFASVAASLSRKPNPARTAAEMNAAVKAAAVKRFKRASLLVDS